MTVQSVGMVDPAHCVNGTFDSGQKTRWTRSFSTIFSYDERVPACQQINENTKCLWTDSRHRQDLTARSPRPLAWVNQLTARWGGAIEPKPLGTSKKMHKKRPIQEQTSDRRTPGRVKGGAKTFKFEDVCFPTPSSRSDL